MNLERYQENELFRNAELSDEVIEEIEFEDCTFEHCTIEDCKIIRCKFTDCEFTDCIISNPETEHSNMMDCRFTRCYLTGINWNELRFGGSYLIPIDKLEDCHLKYNNFLEINFARFDFSNNSIVASLFADCNLTSGKFLNCELDRTEFYRCDLSKADFRHATGYVMEIGSNKLKGAKFSFPEVVNLLNGLGIVIE